MSKKNRKNNKGKGKESDGRGSSNGGGSNSNNNSNNNNNSNHNTNISIPTVDETVVATTTTTTIVLTQTELEYIENDCELKGYPRSNYLVVGYRLMKAKSYDLAVAKFIRGAKNDGIVGCMYFYAYLQSVCNKIHLLVPFALEGAIRGHTGCMALLIAYCYNKSKPEHATALSSFWVKKRTDLGADLSDTRITEEERKKLKKYVANMCIVCAKLDTVDKTFEKCGICKYYSYCGKKCQTYHWKEQNHMGECRQLQILREYCKLRHVKEIRAAIINGEDPKDIPRLQNLRTALGLNRPKEEYEELLLHLGDNNDISIQDRYNYLTARKDGTVNIGSTPEAI